MIHQLCICKYRNPIEFVCTFQECPKQRLICISCAQEHKQYDSKVLQINEFETMITNDSLVQRIQDVQNAQGINNSLDQLIQIAQTDIMQILQKRCTELQDKVKNQHNPFNRAVHHITNISRKYYTSSTVDSLVKELDICDIYGQLQKMEAAKFQKFTLICKEILVLSDALNNLRKACQEDTSPELQSIRNYILFNLEYNEVKQKSLDNYDLNEDIEMSSVQQKTEQTLKRSQILKQKQHYLQDHLNMQLSYLELFKQSQQLQEQASNKTLHGSQYVRENESNQLIRYECYDLDKKKRAN